ncbi:rhodanese-like domain-containing protein [Silvimonas amylolytica]|nr:rhodanese-like domain-containing protein [Silvimonas amylolytica]
MQQLTAQELAAWLQDETRTNPVLLDVREGWEFAMCHLDGSTHLPMNEIPQRFAELDEDAEIVVICHHGMRSYQVGVFLERQGFGHISNLSGGVDAWAGAVDPAMARY